MKHNLKKLRKNAGYKSAKAFAEAHGLAVSTYTDHEQGRRGLSLEAAWRYADILDCTLDELAGREVPAKEFSDPRQEAINRDFEVMDDAMKDAAAASMSGMAAASVRGEDESAGNKAS